MKLSAKTEYACIAMLELARRYERREPVRIRDIADEHGIPARFLVQILLQLKGAGYVASTRGASGGYQLVKSPRVRVLSRVWQDIVKRQQELLRSITFAELAERTKGAAEQMYYI